VSHTCERKVSPKSEAEDVTKQEMSTDKTLLIRVLIDLGEVLLEVLGSVGPSKSLGDDSKDVVDVNLLLVPGGELFERRLEVRKEFLI
jgi:hypothetical protein